MLKFRVGTLKIRGKWLGKIPVGHAGDPRGPRCLHRRVRSRGMKAIRVQTPLKIRAQVVGHDARAAR
jgi:hypothetical protein